VCMLHIHTFVHLIPSGTFENLQYLQYLYDMSYVYHVMMYTVE